jgi:predicted MFS family arabinose efflux permease
MIPMLVTEDLVVPANAVEASSFNVALIAGPAVAGALAAISGPEASLVGEAVLTLVALVLVLRIPGLDSGGQKTAESMRRLVAMGLRHVVREPVIRAVTVTGLVNMAAMGLLIVAFPLWAVSDLGAGANAAGYLWAAFAFGSLVGALTLSQIQARYAQDAVFFFGLAFLSVGMLIWPLAGSLVVALLLVAVSAVPEGPALAADFAIRQQRTPPGLVAQVMTTLGSVKVAAFSVGAAAAGPVVAAAGPSRTVLIAAVFQCVGVIAGGAMRLASGPGISSR